MKEALERSNLSYTLSVISDGVEALAFLQHLDQYATAPRPDLILLDWNLPRKNGLEVLDDIKQDISLRSIPVLFLSSSEEISLFNAKHHLADVYISRPAELSDFSLVIDAIHKLGLNSSNSDR